MIEKLQSLLENRKFVIVVIVLVAILSFAAQFYQPTTTFELSDLPHYQDADIAALINKIEDNDQNMQAVIDLSYAYLQKVRETFDTSIYKEVYTLIVYLETIDPEHVEIPALKAQVALGRHQFDQAKISAQDAMRKKPTVPGYYGILADAQIELGQYDQAVKTLRGMVNLRPDFLSYSRIAYARELHGDRQGAIEMMHSTIKAGAAYPENIAWAHTELGKLYFQTDLALAERHFSYALEFFDNYTPALQGLGKTAFANGDLDQAESYFLRAYEVLPITGHATDLADFYQIRGDEEKSDQYLDIVQITYGISERNGINIDQELALFLLDHQIALDEAFTRASRAYERRPGIYSADVLAWAYFQNKQFEKAAKLIEEALKLKTEDARLYFHAYKIYQALGNEEKAEQFKDQLQETNNYHSLLYMQQRQELIS